MALIDYRISTLAVQCECTPSPIVPDAAALQVIVSRYDPQFIIDSSVPTNNNNVYSSEHGLPFIPGSSLPVGSEWLIYYQLSAGSSTSTAMAFASLVVGAHAVSNPAPYSVGTGWFECTAHGTPEFMNGSHMAGLFPYTGEGRILEFWLQSTQGNSVPVYFGGMMIIAIRMDTPGAVMVKGSDFSVSDYNGIFDKNAADVISISTTYIAIDSTFCTVPSAEDYVIFASCDVNMALNESAKCRLMLDGVQQRGEWVKQAADNRDVHSFTFMGRVNLAPGAHTITIEGAKFNGTAQAKFNKPKIAVLKLSSFGGHMFTRLPLPAITATYPAWDTVMGLSYETVTPGAYVLSMGQGMVRRGNASASMMCRILNQVTNQPLTEFTTTAHPTADGVERTTLISGAAELVGFGGNTYKWQVCGEPGFSSNPLIGDPSWEPAFLVLELSKAGAFIPPVNVTLSGSESITPSESPTIFGQPAGPFVGIETITGTGDTGRLIVEVPTNIPSTHPRLWIYNNDRLAYWQSKVGSTVWNNLIADIPNHYIWMEAMAYKATGNTTYRDNVLARLDAHIALDTVPEMGNIFQSQGLQVDETIRTFAMCYDWLYDEINLGNPNRKQKMQDYMLGLVYWTLNNETPFAQGIYPGSGSPSQEPWAVGNPFQNFNTSHLLQATYVALVLHGEQPDTVGWPPGSTTNRVQFIIPSHTGSGSFTDLYEFVIDALENNCLPEWVQCADGGAWHEGSNYGNSALRRQAEIFSLLDDTTGSNYRASNSYLKERILYMLYEQQPGRNARIQLGDGGASQQFPVDDVVRMCMLTVVDGFRGTIEGDYGQHWLINESGYARGTEGGWDFWLLREDMAGVNYTAQLPLHYHAPGIGFLNSRSDWSSTGISVTFVSGRIKQNHQHADQNQVQIYKGPAGGIDGWMLTDAQPFGGSDQRDSVLHNTYSTASAQGHQRFDLADFNSDDWDGATPVQGKIDRMFPATLYTYAQGNCESAYWTLSSTGWPCDHRIAKINEIFLREFVHIRPGYVILFDRFRLAAAFAGEAIDCNFNFGRNSPAQSPGGSGNYVLDNSAGGASPARRIWFKPEGDPNNSDPPVFTDWGAPDAWRCRVRMRMADGRNGTMLTTFHVTTAATAQMIPTERSAENPTFGFGSYRGITIKDATYYHVLFSMQMDGSTPSGDKTYDVNKQNSTDIHLVFNLQPGIRYLVTETSQPAMGATYYRYSLAVSTVSGFVSNSGGAIQFTPADLPNQGSIPLTESEHIDGTVNMLETGTLTIAKLLAQTTESFGTTEEGRLIVFTAPGTPIMLSGIEAITPDDSPGLGFNLNGTEILGVFDSGALTSESIYAEYTTYVEKTIASGGPDLIPVADLGSSFSIPEPNDGVFFDKLADEDDGTLVHIPLPLPAFVPFSDIAVLLGNAYIYQGTIRSVRFKLKVVSANVIGASNPVLNVRLFDSSLGTIITQYSIPLLTTDTLIELESPMIQVQVPSSLVPVLGLGIKLRASTYGPNMSCDISRAWVEITSDSTEKVIA